MNRRSLALLISLLLAMLLPGCQATEGDGRTVLTFPSSGVGLEAKVLERQVQRFMRAHPDIEVRLERTPDAGDQRRQLYVQWLNAGRARPDVLQLDVIWTPEFAAADWLLPLPEPRDAGDFFESTLTANRWRETLYALPWFVDVGMLYYRSDLLPAPPKTLAELAREADSARRTHGVRYGLVWQNARYEGLVTNFLEVLSGYGGTLLDDQGRVRVDSPAAISALEFMQARLRSGAVPREALGWQEEQSRLAFQRGEALFLRNWPYAAALMNDSSSPVAGKFRVTAVPGGPARNKSATLGGSQLAINRHSRHPDEARALIEFLTAPSQMLERAILSGQLPARQSLFEDPRLQGALAFPPDDVRSIVDHAVPRPPHPLYAKLSSALQPELSRALSGQVSARAALERAEAAMRRIMADEGFDETQPAPQPTKKGPSALEVALALTALLSVAVGIAWRRRPPRRDSKVAWLFLLPTLAIMALVGLVPLLLAIWESLHVHDLAMPHKGHPFVGVSHYVAWLSSSRLWGAVLRTACFAIVSSSLELVLGMLLALTLARGGALLRVARPLALIPWALPTVVAALVWRFLFEGRESLANLALGVAGAESIAWLSDGFLAWLPVLLADIWKTTPFVALLVLAGLSGIDPRLYQAAKLDGAGSVSRFFSITLPLLRPTLIVALLFRLLDALRVFDLIYTLTGGGPGTATEPLQLLNFSTLLEHLRFGQGSALGMILFALSVVAAALVLFLGHFWERAAK